ncbi:MAG: SpoIIE family protein phosphatase [Candidatus Riflebacteria bacterium]|nr:SpoIIE family protein phosphatase [Candidatus Riflebacteria bacterium]
MNKEQNISTFEEAGIFSQFLRLVSRNILFCWFPFLILALTIYIHNETLSENHKEHFFSLLQSDIQTIVNSGTPTVFLEKCFGYLAAKTFKKDRKTSLSEDFFLRYSKQWDVSFDTYIFDKSGNISMSASFKSQGKNLIKKMLPYLADAYKSHSSVIGKPNYPEDSQKAFKGFKILFGEDFSISRLKSSRGISFPFTSQGKSGIIFWDTDSKSGIGMIFIAWQAPSSQKLISMLMKTRLNRKLKLFLMPVDKKTVSFFNPHVTFPGYNVIERELSVQDNWLSPDSNGWVSVHTSDFSCFAGRQFKTLEPTIFYRLLPFYLIVNIFFTMLHIVWQMKNWEFPISIENKIAGLFFFTLGLPLLTLSLLAFRASEEGRKARLIESLDDSRRWMTSIDRDFIEEKKKFTRTFELFVQKQANESSFERIQKSLKNVFQKLNLNVLYAVDISGKMKLDLNESENHSIMKTLFTEFSRACLETKFKERIKDENVVIESSGASSIRLAFQSSNSGFPNFIDNPNSLHQIEFGDQSHFFCWSPCPKKDHPLALVIAGKRTHQMAKDFLEKRLKKQKFPLITPFAVFSFDGAKQFIPSWFPKDTALIDFAREVKFSRISRNAKFRIGKKSFQAFVIPCAFLPDFVLIALVPLKPLIDFTRNIQLLTMAITIFVILYSWFILLALKHIFLIPMKIIFKGIEALKKREKSWRVPLLANDEFGELGQTINSTLEYLKEIDMGTIVQKKLFPQTELATQYIRIFGRLPWSDTLNGYYLDYGEIPEKGVWAVLGKTSADGVSAALVMAVSKAIFSQTIGTKTVEEIVEILNMVLRKSFEECFPLSLSISWIPPKDDMVNMYFFGWPSPLLIEKKRTVRQLELLKGRPIGLSPSVQYYHAKICLEEENIIIVSPMDSAYQLSASTVPPTGKISVETILESFSCLKDIPFLVIERNKKDSAS